MIDVVSYDLASIMINYMDEKFLKIEYKIVYSKYFIFRNLSNDQKYLFLYQINEKINDYRSVKKKDQIN